MKLSNRRDRGRVGVRIAWRKGDRTMDLEAMSMIHLLQFDSVKHPTLSPCP